MVACTTMEPEPLLSVLVSSALAVSPSVLAASPSVLAASPSVLASPLPSPSFAVRLAALLSVFSVLVSVFPVSVEVSPPVVSLLAASPEVLLSVETFSASDWLATTAESLAAPFSALITVCGVVVVVCLSSDVTIVPSAFSTTMAASLCMVLNPTAAPTPTLVAASVLCTLLVTLISPLAISTLELTVTSPSVAVRLPLSRRSTVALLVKLPMLKVAPIFAYWFHPVSLVLASSAFWLSLLSLFSAS